MGFLDFLFGKGGTANSSNTKKADMAKRWELRGRTGQGSMSKVYQAYDREMGRTICLKILDKVKTAAFEGRFKGLNKPSEGEICMQLNSPHCVRTYEWGYTTQGEPYLVMEWIEGVGLNYLIETKSPQLKGNRIPYLVQICDGIQYMHDNKWLHRDICPRNVMVDKEGVVKLIDFGLTIPYTPAFCAPGNRTGSTDQLAPEVVKRQRTDHRVDLFMLGCTAFELLTEQLPWEKSASSEETFRRRMNTRPRNAKEMNPSIDEDIHNVLMKSISREPQERYATATQFRDALLGVKRQDY